MLSSLCRVCGTRIDPVAGAVHMACEKPYSDWIAASDQRYRAGLRRALAGKTAALNANTEHKIVGMDIIRRAAYRLPVLSAHDVRNDMEAAGVPVTKLAGALWSAAASRGWVVKQSETTGGDSANGKRIAVYRSCLYRKETAA